ncbi:glycosyltransferase family 2 protein [Thalassotalea litorea]|nr:glycosyltransferase [Thalassotalea litorea]
MKKKIAILLTCFNRKDLTIDCLKKIEKQKQIEGYNYQIFLVDDGSDGTGEEVGKLFDNVNVLSGNGALFWSGGMRLAFKEAMKWGPDFYLWLNDDALIYEDSLYRLLVQGRKLVEKGCSGILLGSMEDPNTGQITYGGKVRASKFSLSKVKMVLPDRTVCLPCDLINGNLVLIPKIVADKLGNIKEVYTHGLGDYDYGLRAQKAGFQCLVAPGVYGACSNNKVEGTCRDSQLTVKSRIRMLEGPVALPPINEWLYYTREHGGILWPLFWSKSLIRKWFPSVWVKMREK